MLWIGREREGGREEDGELAGGGGGGGGRKRERERNKDKIVWPLACTNHVIVT